MPSCKLLPMRATEGNIFVWRLHCGAIDFAIAGIRKGQIFCTHVYGVGAAERANKTYLWMEVQLVSLGIPWCSLAIIFVGHHPLCVLNFRRCSFGQAVPSHAQIGIPRGPKSYQSPHLVHQKMCPQLRPSPGVQAARFWPILPSASLRASVSNDRVVFQKQHIVVGAQIQ